MSHIEGCNTTHCVACSGADPTWRGGPDQKMVAVIQALFKTDSEGRRYFQFSYLNPPRRIHDHDFPEINRILDEYRRPLGGYRFTDLAAGRGSQERIFRGNNLQENGVDTLAKVADQRARRRVQPICPVHDAEDGERVVRVQSFVDQAE